MGPFDVGNGLFFFSISQAQPNKTHNRETGTVKTGLTVAPINNNRCITRPFWLGVQPK